MSDSGAERGANGGAAATSHGGTGHRARLRERLLTGGAEALADYDAVLTLSPDSHRSRYMRGITRLKMGDKGGRQDIDLALRARPMLAREYAVWGFKPD